MTELHHPAGADWREPKFGEWRTIESAPIKPFDKENWYMPHSESLLLFSGFAMTGSYGYTKQGKGRWRCNGFTRQPTHWMPLPPPPEPPK